MTRKNRKPPGISPVAAQGPRPARPAGKVYTFTRKHFLILTELERLYPDLGPVADFARMEPGTESIESVSRQLLDRLSSKWSEPLFLAFCKINAERMRDFIEWALTEEGWPFLRDEVLAELYASMFRGLVRGGTSQAGRGPWRWPAAGRSAYGAMTRTVMCVLEDRVDKLLAQTLPLPGLPSMGADPPDATVEEVSIEFSQRSLRLDEEDLRQWVSHALLRLNREHRQALYLHDVYGMKVTDLGERLEINPFEAGRRLNQARLKLIQEIDRLVTAFYGDLEPEERASSSNTDDHEDRQGRPPIPMRPVSRQDEESDDEG